MRQCSECFTLKPSTAFSSSQRRKSASKQRCTACTGAAAAAPSKRNAPAARSLPAAMKSMSRQLREDEEAEAVVRDRPLVDIGINLTNSQFKRDWKAVVARAQRAGVVTMLLTGTSLKASRKSLDMARAWRVEQGAELDATALRCTVGVHPHDASTFAGDATLGAMRDMLSDPLTVAVGECGLDYNRMKCPKAVQMRCFRAQLELAVELDRPVFVHEREAHDDLVAVTDAVAAAVAPRPLPPIVIHCFTGTLAEAQAYVVRGFFIGFTGTICKKERGAPLRALLPHLPLDRIMIETDAPYMGFVKGRRRSEPADVVGVAEKLAETLGVSLASVAAQTTASARSFFRL